MTATFTLHVAGLFILVAASEMLNGIARTIFLLKRVGVMNAKRISLLSALALCLLICYSYVPFLKIMTNEGLLLSEFHCLFSWEGSISWWPGTSSRPGGKPSWMISIL
jgi:hypothetical protein